MTRQQTLHERFWRRVQSGPFCWEWQGARLTSGYGVLSLGQRRKRMLAHRASWELHFGSIPEGMHVLHTCDNPPCVHPGHLFLGTDADNMADARAKGRTVPPPHYRGEKHHSSLLSDVDRAALIAARNDGVPPRVLAERFGVPVRHVYNITHEARKAAAA